MISRTVVLFSSTGGRYVTHLSVRLRQALRLIFWARSKQVTHLLHLLSRTFPMLTSGIIGSASVCACARARNAQGTAGKWSGNLYRAAMMSPPVHGSSSAGERALIGFPSEHKGGATPLSVTVFVSNVHDIWSVSSARREHFRSPQCSVFCCCCCCLKKKKSTRHNTAIYWEHDN